MTTSSSQYLHKSKEMQSLRIKTMNVHINIIHLALILLIINLYITYICSYPKSPQSK